MTRRKKLVLGLAVITVAIVAGLLVLGNMTISRMTERLIGQIVARGKEKGVEIDSAAFARARISSWNAATWSQVRGNLRFTRHAEIGGKKRFAIQMDSATVRLASWEQVAVDARNIQVDMLTADTTKPAGNVAETTPAAQQEENRSKQDSLRIESLRMACDINPRDPMAGMERLVASLIELTSTGKATMPLEIVGVVTFPVKGHNVSTRCRVEKRYDQHVLVLDEDDLRQLSARFGKGLTPAEIRLVSQNPLRAPTLLRIKEHAERESQGAHQRDEHVPKDAFRHVLWSYLLTREYGEAFAKVVTDAHEEGNTGNTPAERDMDYHNNTIGREYGKSRIVEHEVLAKLLADPRVMRQPQ